MARPRGPIGRRYRCSRCGSDEHNALRCPAAAVVREVVRVAGATVIVGQHPQAASLTYVLDSLDLALEDHPHRRQFDLPRAWLVKILGAARAEDRRRRGVLR